MGFNNEKIDIHKRVMEVYSADVIMPFLFWTVQYDGEQLRRLSGIEKGSLAPIIEDTFQTVLPYAGHIFECF